MSKRSLSRLSLDRSNFTGDANGQNPLESPSAASHRSMQSNTTGISDATGMSRPVVKDRVPVLDQVFHKVAIRLSELPEHRLLAMKNEGRKQVILVGSGAYNPIHKMHLRNFYIARKYLEEHTTYEVLGGLVSPAHATEVRSKYRQRPREIIPPKHRLAMARKAVGDSTWLTVDPWEITRRRVMDYLSVLDHVQTLFDSCFPGLPIKIILLCNPSVLVKLSPDDLRDHNYGCLCICRPQETDQLMDTLGSRWRNVAYVVEDAAILSRELEATGSRRVRETAMAGGKVEAMVGAPVANYIVKEKLGNKMAGRERWNVRDKEFQLESGLAPQVRPLRAPRLTR